MTDQGDPGHVRTLLFDMGGVLVELGDPATVFGLDTGTDQFLERWLCAPSVRDFERGHIDIGSFAERVVGEAALSYDTGEFVERFMSWPRGIFAGTQELLQSIPGSYRRVLLSNTNRQHWYDAGLAGQLMPLLDRAFLSFETGLLKPDAAAFRHVFESLDCAPEEVAFFDDNAINVEAAKALGCHAFRTRGIGELRSAIDQAISDSATRL